MDNPATVEPATKREDSKPGPEKDCETTNCLDGGLELVDKLLSKDCEQEQATTSAKSLFGAM